MIISPVKCLDIWDTHALEELFLKCSGGNHTKGKMQGMNCCIKKMYAHFRKGCFEWLPELLTKGQE